MQTVLGIHNAHHYWQEVVEPNAIEYERTKTARSAFNLATCLWHLQEWVVVQLNPDADKTTLKDKKKSFRLELLQECPELGILHDIATAHKHAVVSTPNGKVASSDSQITGVHFSFIGGKPVTEHESMLFVTLEDGSRWALDEVFGAAFNYLNYKLPIWCT